RRAIATTQSVRGGADRLREVLAPGAPGVSARYNQEAVANTQPGELVREGFVLGEKAVASARVEPNVGSSAAEPAGDGGEVRAGARVSEWSLGMAEERGGRVGGRVP